MRKVRVDETSKEPVTKSRSQSKSKIQVTTKTETSSDKKKKAATTTERRQTKSIVSSSSLTSTKKNAAIEESEQRSTWNLTSKKKVTGSSRSSLANSTRESPKTKSDSSIEKRGTSTIYMPKSGTSRKLLRSGESNEYPTDRNKNTSSKEKADLKTRREQTIKTKEASVGSKKQYPTSRRVSSRERRRSRTLSPSEVKVLKKNPSVQSDGEKEIILSQAHSSKVSNSTEDTTAKNETDDEYQYEDDFESYESDFEECTDSELSEAEPIEMQTEKQKTRINSVDGRKFDEERMLDSGHYELAEARRRAATIESVSVPRDIKQQLNNEIIIQPSNGPYRDERSSENKSLPSSSTDEGFEDARSGDFAKSPPMSQLNIIDFRKTIESTTTRRPTRGEKLLEMIKLDTVEWSILESKPVAYEEYIRTHGKFNTRQISIQTNEDNLNAETQTESIECTTKWTQFPTRCRNILKNDEDIKLFNMERLGVGAENYLETANAKYRPIFDVLQFNEFLSKAGKVMLSLLEERSSGNNSSNDDIHQLPFSESVVKLSIDSVTFLTDRPVTIIHYSNVSNRILLTIHAPVDEEIETSRDQDFVTDCSIGCVWNILQPSTPIKLFYSSSSITACCFHSNSCNVVLGGLADGSISIWDLAEDETWHRNIIDEANQCGWVVRSPTYSTIGNYQQVGHNSEIVALRVLSKIEGESAHNKFIPIQIGSLDENGRLIVWSVLRNLSHTVDDLGLSWWGDVRLVKSQEISLISKKGSERKNHLKGFSDMHVDRLDTNALYIATNTPNVMHATRIGKHTNPPAYKSNGMDWCGYTKCIENCPFDQPFFMVGCADGTVRLHSTTTEKPLLQLKYEECNAPIKTVQWSSSKPLTIYVLDVDSKIHIWDLGSSDIFPVHTIPTNNWGHIESIELSPCTTAQEMTNQYMALALDNGRVEVHRLKEEFYYTHKDAVKREMNTFLRYVAIL